jgi:hypothetical protein
VTDLRRMLVWLREEIVRDQRFAASNDHDRTPDEYGMERCMVGIPWQDEGEDDCRCAFRYQRAEALRRATAHRDLLDAIQEEMQR